MEDMNTLTTKEAILKEFREKFQNVWMCNEYYDDLRPFGDLQEYEDIFSFLSSKIDEIEREARESEQTKIKQIVESNGIDMGTYDYDGIAEGVIDYLDSLSHPTDSPVEETKVSNSIPLDCNCSCHCISGPCNSTHSHYCIHCHSKEGRKEHEIV